MWSQRRREVDAAALSGADEGVESPGGGGANFTDVDLGGGGARGSPYGAGGNGAGPRGQGLTAGLGELLTSGFNALAGTGPTSSSGGGYGHNHHHHHGGEPHQESDGFLSDDDVDFDEEAFRRAQEEESRRRLERVRETKRALKNWAGYRMDLVEGRRGGGAGCVAVGEVFDI